MAMMVGGCINEQHSASVRDPLPSLTSVQKAQSNQQPYVKLGNGRYRLIAQITFETRHFGRVFLNPGYVSDGSSSPIKDMKGSLLAGFLHDALYHGSPSLEFKQGFPGRWSKLQADQEYCFQMKRFGVPAAQRRANCRGLKLLPAIISPWDHHRKGREKYWKTQQKLQKAALIKEG